MKTSYETQAELACKTLRNLRETPFLKREREEFMEMLHRFEMDEPKKSGRLTSKSGDAGRTRA